MQQTTECNKQRNATIIRWHSVPRSHLTMLWIQFSGSTKPPVRACWGRATGKPAAQSSLPLPGRLFFENGHFPWFRGHHQVWFGLVVWIVHPTQWKFSVFRAFFPIVETPFGLFAIGGGFLTQSMWKAGSRLQRGKWDAPIYWTVWRNCLVNCIWGCSWGTKSIPSSLPLPSASTSRSLRTSTSQNTGFCPSVSTSPFRPFLLAGD